MPRSPIRRFASFALIVGPLLSACSTVPLGDEVDPATVRPTAAIYAPEDLRAMESPNGRKPHAEVAVALGDLSTGSVAKERA